MALPPSAPSAPTTAPKTVTRIIPTPLPIMRVAFGPDGKIAIASGAWIREIRADGSFRVMLDGIAKTSRTRVAYDHRGVLELTDAPFAPAQKRETPSTDESTQTDRVLMDGGDAYAVSDQRVTRVGTGETFVLPPWLSHERLSAVVSTPFHVLVTEPNGAHVFERGNPTHGATPLWRFTGEFLRLPGGAVTASQNGSNRAILWLHELGANVFISDDSVRNFIRFDDKTLMSWRMKRDSLVVTSYSRD